MITKKRIILAILAATVIVLLLSIPNWINAGWLELVAPATTPGDKEVTVVLQRENEAEQTLTLKPGEHKSVHLKAGPIQVNATSGPIQSIDVITVKSYATVKLDVPTGTLHKATKIGSEPRTCPVVVAGVLYSYDCVGAEGPITQHARTSIGTSNTLLFNGDVFSGLEKVKNGLIGFKGGTDTAIGTLVYIDLQNRTVQDIQLPAEVAALASNDYAIIATRPEPGATHFTLYFIDADKLYLFADINDQSPVALETGQQAPLTDPNRIHRISFSGDTLSLLSEFTTEGRHEDHEGTLTTPEEEAYHDEEVEKIEPKPSYLFEYDLGGKLVSTAELPADVGNTLYKLAGNFYGVQRVDGFAIYSRSQDTMTHIYTMPNVDSWVTQGDKSYLTAGGALFELAPGNDGSFALHSVFALHDISVSTVSLSPIGVLFTATAYDAAANTYQLNEAMPNPAIVATQPTFVGFEALDRFLSTEQVANLKQTLVAYGVQSSAALNDVVASSVVALPYDKNSTSLFSSLTFSARINGSSSFNARVEYGSLTEVRLYLSDGSGAQIFDSGNGQPK